MPTIRERDEAEAAIKADAVFGGGRRRMQSSGGA